MSLSQDASHTIPMMNMPCNNAQAYFVHMLPVLEPPKPNSTSGSNSRHVEKVFTLIVQIEGPVTKRVGIAIVDKQAFDNSDPRDLVVRLV